MKKTRICMCLIVFMMLFVASCMSGSGDPVDEDTPCCTDHENDTAGRTSDDDDGGDDDDAADDDDEADDDDAADDDDDATDDDDDAADDDDEAPDVECADLVDLIYDDCTAEISDGLGQRLSKDDALKECDGQYSFFKCAESCRIDDPECEAFSECVGQCSGGYTLN